MPRKRVLEGLRVEDRAAQRQRLGTLRELTVQPSTRKRYTQATDAFLQFIRAEGRALPTDKTLMDPLVCDYLEHLWSSGKGRGQACDTLAGLQDLQPNLKGQLAGAWRLMKAWTVNEIPNRAPPFPEHLLLALVGWAFFKNEYTFGISLLIGFYTMLRTGEVLGLRASHLMCSPHERQVLISLGLTKGGKRQGAAESVVLGYEPAVRLVKHWKQLATAATPLATSPARWRRLFNDGLEALHVTDWGFRPYSLRRGGATFWFSKRQSLDRILIQGRWHTQKSARVYLNEGLAILAQMQIPVASKFIRPYFNIHAQQAAHPHFQTLEPLTKVRRSGASGKKPKSGKKRQGKSVFQFAQVY